MLLDLEKAEKAASLIADLDIEKLEDIKKKAEILIFMSTKMLTREEVAAILNCSTQQVGMYIDTGIIEGIKTGKSVMIPQQEIMDFQKRFKGHDLSNKQAVIAALKQGV